jgi:CDP-diacylglycerol---glycerol-3-phosphate 3-phosphatidyltransferase
MSGVAFSLNLPNQLTLGRLALCFFFVATLSFDWVYSATAALVIFLVASLTDWLDGWIARRYELITDLGKLLDPLADKILISAAFVGLMDYGYAPMWMVVIIISREFLITGLRIVAANRGYIMAAEKAGKHKTITQMVVIIVSLLLMSAHELQWINAPFFTLLAYTQEPLLWLALLITVTSGATYFYKNRGLFVLETEPPVIPPPLPSEPIVAATFPAFKEWQIIVEALGSGQQAIILRKGGIAEGRAGFQVQHKRFWLFPTRFHQQREKTKLSAAAFPLEVAAEESPVRLSYYAEVTQVGYLHDWNSVLALEPFHYWTEEALRERFDWSKEPGLHCIMVRVYRLAEPVIVPWSKDYAGCKSWVDLPTNWADQAAAPVLSEQDFATLREKITRAANLKN